MHLQWFPGHMTKALRMMEQEVKLCDGIVMVLDARAPFACLNKKLDGVFQNKPVIYALNKSDLVNSEDIKEIESKFIKEGKTVVSVVGTSEKTATKLYGAIVSALSSVKKRYEQKGVKKPLRVMVAGIPNTGKSTLINLLCGSKRASVSVAPPKSVTSIPITTVIVTSEVLKVKKHSPSTVSNAAKAAQPNFKFLILSSMKANASFETLPIIEILAQNIPYVKSARKLMPIVLENIFRLLYDLF